MMMSPEPEPKPAPPADSDKPETGGRFAAYDTRYLRFVGGVVDTKAKAKAEAKAAGLETSDYYVREV